MKSERAARWLVLGVLVGVALIPMVSNLLWKRGVVEVLAVLPEKGGWLPDNLYAQVGEPLHLRIASGDVVHSFALGRSDFTPVDIHPGRPVDVSLLFDQPGTHTFYCTRWCGADHWRMRGTITVTGDGLVNETEPDPPLYQQLGIDLDAPHQPTPLNWTANPSANRGKSQNAYIPPQFLTRDFYHANSPIQVWGAMRSDAAYYELTDTQLWDLVAWVWQENTSPEMITQGQALYQRDCAACHGVEGRGDGVFGHHPDELAWMETGDLKGHSVEAPTNFREAGQMVGSSPARLQGMIIRGGMGTGMPSWGLIYTEEQTWALADYLWTFIFQYDNQE